MDVTFPLMYAKTAEDLIKQGEVKELNNYKYLIIKENEHTEN